MGTVFVVVGEPVVGRKLDLDGGIWQEIYALNDNFGMLGYLLVGLFAVSWIVSMIVYRLKGYENEGAATG